MYESVPLTDDVVALLRKDANAQGRDIGAVASDALRNFYAVARNTPFGGEDLSEKPYPVVYFGDPDDENRRRQQRKCFRRDAAVERNRNRIFRAFFRRKDSAAESD